MVTSARRWNSFVCPGCRFVFRVPQDHDGKGVVCPACRVMLRLPGPDDEVPPLVLPPRREEAEPAEIEEFEAEDDATAAVAAVRSDRNFIAGLALAAITLLGLFWWWMKPGETKRENAPAVLESSVPSGGKSVEMEPAARSLIMEVESVVRAFLEAPTPAEAMRWVREPAETSAKLEARLAGRPYVAPGFRGIVNDSVATTGADAHIMSVQVRTADFQLREIAVVKVDGKVKVDWDSWAGWSEMSWADFQRLKPTTPKLFRVELSQVDYYNFEFKDDREWSSYRLDSQDGADSLFGYVRRTSELDQQIRPVDEGLKVKLLLRLKYPADAMSGSKQVLIDSLAGEGWVESAASGGR